ncbi:MAG: hypothetical protein AAF772_05715 [Acidobacteriota bacterium]
MGIISGAASITRFTVSPVPDEIDFEPIRFEAIPARAEVRERIGVVPLDPGAPYEAGARRWFFRVRFDTVKPDPTAVQERLKQLIYAELEMTGATGVGPKKRKRLKQQAEEELVVDANPRSKIIECCIDGETLYVGTTANAALGTIMALLRQIGLVAAFKTPWIDLGEPDFESPLIESFEPGASALGCRFLRHLLGERGLMIEPESGYVKLQAPDARITLSGAVLPELHRYVERGAEVLAAKLLTPTTSFRLDGLTFRMTGMRVESSRQEHWTETLDERLRMIEETWDLLDQTYARLRDQLRR